MAAKRQKIAAEEPDQWVPGVTRPVASENTVTGNLTPDDLTFTSVQAVPLDSDATVMIVGQAEAVRTYAGTLLPEFAPAVLDAMVAACKPGDAGSSVTTFSPSGGILCFGIVPSSASRHNVPCQPHAVNSVVSAMAGKASDKPFHIISGQALPPRLVG